MRSMAASFSNSTSHPAMPTFNTAGWLQDSPEPYVCQCESRSSREDGLGKEVKGVTVTCVHLSEAGFFHLAENLTWVLV